MASNLNAHAFASVTLAASDTAGNASGWHGPAAITSLRTLESTAQLVIKFGIACSSPSLLQVGRNVDACKTVIAA